MKHGPLPEYQKPTVRSMATELQQVNSEVFLIQHGTSSDAALASSILHLSSICQMSLFWHMGTARNLCLLLGTSQLPQTAPAKSCSEQQSPGRSGGGLTCFPLSLQQSCLPLVTWPQQRNGRWPPRRLGLTFWLGLLSCATKPQSTEIWQQLQKRP